MTIEKCFHCNGSIAHRIVNARWPEWYHLDSDAHHTYRWQRCRCCTDEDSSCAACLGTGMVHVIDHGAVPLSKFVRTT